MNKQLILKLTITGQLIFMAKTKSSNQGVSSHEECDKPVCKSKMDMFKKSLKFYENSKEIELHNNKDDVMNQNSYQPIIHSCPIDIEELGQSTWNLIHTIAANTPELPSEEYQNDLQFFFKSLANLYPCHICAPDFQQYIKNSPPEYINYFIFYYENIYKCILIFLFIIDRVTSREDISIWCCRLHNHINEKLGKPTVSCDIKNLDKRWIDGEDSCWTNITKDNHNHFNEENK
jgi:FAD-linked sulfhydryl oxidase